jgi:hypothetical protein
LEYSANKTEKDIVLKISNTLQLTAGVNNFPQPPLEVKAAPRQKAIHYLHMGQQPLKQK